MPFDAYTARFGVHQGRIQPTNHEVSVGLDGVVDGTTAALTSDAAETYALTDGAEFQITVDRGARQTMIFDAADFAAIGTATAAETGAAIAAEIGAARLLSVAEPFELTDGDTVLLRVEDGADQTATFATGDFADISAATAAEVSAALTAAWADVTLAEVAGRVVLRSASVGPTAKLEVTGGAGNLALGFSELASFGSNGVAASVASGQVVLTSQTVGAAGCLLVSDPQNDNANQVLNFPIEEVCGTTGAYALVLGHDIPGMLDTLEAGDEVSVTQAGVVMNDGDLLRVLGEIRVPNDMPADYTWQLSFAVGAFEEDLQLASTDFADQTFVLFDFGSNVSQVASETISITLSLEGPAGEVEVELPSVFLDIVQGEEDAADMLLLNRVPYPDQTGVPASVPTEVQLLIVSTNGDAVDSSTVTVTIAGVLAYDAGGGGFQAGFSGTVTAGTGPSSDDFRISVDVSGQAYTSEQLISVAVTADTVGASAALATSYNFTIADTTVPTVTAASPRAKNVVRVAFSEPVLLNASDAGALNPSNYSFERQSQPAVLVEPAAVSIVEGSTSSVDVTLDVAQTMNALYRVTVSGVADVAGNVVVAPDNTADFAGFVPEIPAGRSFELWRMIGDINRRDDASGETELFLTILQDPVDLMLCSIDAWTDILDPDLAPENFIDAMLCSLGNPFKFDLSVEDKRRLLSVLVAIYQSKGTTFGIIDAIFFFLGVEVTINVLNIFEGGWVLGESELGDSSELYPGDSALRYSFEIISPVALTDDQREKMLSIADYMKVAHEHIVRIVEPTIPTADNTWFLGEGQLGQETALSQTI